MRVKVIAGIMFSAVAAAAYATFVPPQPTHIEPLPPLDFPPTKILADTVVLQLDIDAKGAVTNVAVWSTSGDKQIDTAALAAGKKCTFAAASQDGQPIAATTQIFYRLSSYRRTEYVGADGKKAGTATPKAATAENKPAPPGK